MKNFWAELICDFWKSAAEADRKFDVRVDEQKLNEAAEELARRQLLVPDWHIKGVLPDNHRAFVSHLLYICAAGEFAAFAVHPPWSKFTVDGFTGSQAMARCFYRIFGEKPIAAGQILDLLYCPEEPTLFGKNPPVLLAERLAFLKEVAEGLIKFFDDDPMNILEKANFKAMSGSDSWNLGVVDLLKKHFPQTFGQDYRGPYLRFDKRAQLFVLMYQGRALHSNGELPLLKDPENIGPIIDAQVPNALRAQGILIYSQELAKQIDNRRPIVRGSRQEIEIRSGAFYAELEKLKRINEIRIKQSLPPLTMIELDYYDWTAGQNSRYPNYICITTDY
jgi:hypothetical protein